MPQDGVVDCHEQPEECLAVDWCRPWGVSCCAQGYLSVQAQRHAVRDHGTCKLPLEAPSAWAGLVRNELVKKLGSKDVRPVGMVPVTPHGMVLLRRVPLLGLGTGRPPLTKALLSQVLRTTGRQTTRSISQGCTHLVELHAPRRAMNTLSYAMRAALPR